MDLIVSFSILVEWGLKIYSWVHIAAFLMSWIHADPNNQIVYWINRLTLPMWNWVRFRLPSSISAFAPVIALLLVILGENVLPGVIRALGAVGIGRLPLNEGLLQVVYYAALGSLIMISSIIWFVFLLSVIWFVFTLVNPPLNHPIVRAIWFLIDPLLTPIQKQLPRTKIDLSPVVLAVLALILRSFVNRLMFPVNAGILI